MTDKPPFWHMLTFSQKVAWRCNNPDPKIDYRTWVDKSLAKEIVRPYFKVAEPYLVVERPEDIDIARLPGTFIMKATHGWNMSLLVVDGIVQGGNRNLAGAGRIADTAFLQQVARAWLNSEEEERRRSWERYYRYVNPGILFEQFLSPVDHELQLFLFNGQFHFAMVFYRGFYHKDSSHRLLGERWRCLQPGSRGAASRYEWAAPETPRPSADLFSKLEKLCRSIDHVRADFFVCGNQYYFSEFTFTHNAGKPGFIGKYDAALGRFWTT